MLHQWTIEAAIFALGVTVALVLVNSAWRRSRFVALLVGLCVGHAVSLSVSSNGWREEANQLLNRELLIDTTLETFATRMVFDGVVAPVIVQHIIPDEHFYVLKPGDGMALSCLSMTIARTHHMITSNGVAPVAISQLASSSCSYLGQFSQFFRARALGVPRSWRWSTSRWSTSSSQSEMVASHLREISHVVVLAPPPKLLGGAESDSEVEGIVPDRIRTQDEIQARRIAKGYRGNCNFDGNEFKAMVKSWEPIDGSQNLCCAHALLGIGMRPQIIELYEALIEQLRALGSESTGAEDARSTISAHLPEGMMPSTTAFRWRHDQIKSALTMYQTTGRAPGFGTSLGDSSYLGSFADHIALFSSGWSHSRCHLVVEVWPGNVVDVQKWESVSALDGSDAMHRAVTKDEMLSLIAKYGNRLTCARMDHGVGGNSGLRSSYHHYAASYTFHEQTNALNDKHGASNEKDTTDADANMANDGDVPSGAQVKDATNTSSFELYS